MEIQTVTHEEFSRHRLLLYSLLGVVIPLHITLGSRVLFNQKQTNLDRSETAFKLIESDWLHL